MVREWLATAERGDLAGLKRLWKREPRLLDARGKGPYWTGKARAIQYAASRGHAAVVRWLLDNGASPHPAKGDLDWSPLHFAAVGGHRSVIRMLEKAGARRDIFVAASLGDTAAVRRFLREKSSSVNLRGPDGATPLHFATSAGVARVLLKAGASPTARDRYHHEPVIHWVMAHAGVVRELEKVGVRISVRARPSVLPAVVHGRNWPLVRRLLSEGADPNDNGGFGHNALHAACVYGHLPTIRLMLRHGARLDLKDRTWHATPLGWALHHHHRAAARLLRSIGAPR